ncbi:MAG: hypothetical protein V1779_13045 [bacterium]
MKTKYFSEPFWKQFQTAVTSGNRKDVTKLSYFYSDEDKNYFLATYRDTFDETAIAAIGTSKYTTLKAIAKNTKSPGIGPFELLILPESLNTVYVLNVAYTGEEQVEDDYYTEEEEDYYSDFDKETGFDIDSEKYDDLDFDGDEVVELIKSFVFGEINGEFKFLGTYQLD